jgi:hypothetical protein
MPMFSSSLRPCLGSSDVPWWSLGHAVSFFAGDMLGEYEVLYTPVHIFSVLATQPSEAYVLMKKVCSRSTGTRVRSYLLCIVVWEERLPDAAPFRDWVSTNKGGGGRSIASVVCRPPPSPTPYPMLCLMWLTGPDPTHASP